MSRLLLQISHVFKSLGALSLFENISFSVNEGDMFALIGQNGAGKTTFLKLLAGSISVDAGKFSQIPGLTISFLPQEILVTNPSLTVEGYLEDVNLNEIEKEMSQCLDNPSRIEEWGELHEKFEHLGGYKRIPMEKVLLGLKLPSELLTLPLSQLSSGQRVRVALAKVLIQNPDLLLLDEPTNHMDQEMVEWVQDLLKKREGACIIVSHDRKFLNTVCNQLIEIDKGILTYYGGSYDYYLAEKDRQLERKIKAFEDQKEERSVLRQEIKAATFSKGKATPPTDRNIMCYDRTGEKHEKALQHKLNALKSRLVEIEENLLTHPKPKGITGLKFAPVPLQSPLAIELDHISKSYENKILFSELNYIVRKGDRILITGPNGCGKTTLLKAIAGTIQLEAGKIRVAPSVKMAFLDQEVDLLPMDQTPLVYFKDRFQLTEEDLRREIHKAALGEVDVLKRPFSTLSTGQRKRLMMLSLILEKPNVLLLDEPTNHLDLLTLEAFDKALLEFEGAIIAVSHDSTFIEKICNQRWSLG